MAKFDELPPEFKAALEAHGQAMHLFYTLPTDKRQFILDRIHSFNSSKEMKEYIDELF